VGSNVDIGVVWSWKTIWQLALPVRGVVEWNNRGA
jgi:hypothetical protein